MVYFVNHFMFRKSVVKCKSGNLVQIAQLLFEHGPGPGKIIFKIVAFILLLKLGPDPSQVKTLNDVSKATRAEIAQSIAHTGKWDKLGLQFKNELGKTFSRKALVAETSKNATDVELVQHLVDILAERLLLVSSFKNALVEIGLTSIIEEFADALAE